MMWYGNAMGGWGMALMLAANVLFWAILFTGCYLLVKAARRDASSPAGPSAKQILANRYAAGEIDDEDYQRRLAVLRTS